MPGFDTDLPDAISKHKHTQTQPITGQAR